MNRYERVLVVLMRISAVVLLTALVPTVMPFAWMKEIHRWLGMGELPEGPIVGYLDPLAVGHVCDARSVGPVRLHGRSPLLAGSEVPGRTGNRVWLRDACHRCCRRNAVALDCSRGTICYRVGWRLALADGPIFRAKARSHDAPLRTRLVAPKMWATRRKCHAPPQAYPAR